MRRAFLYTLASVAVIVAMPAVAMAHAHHHQRHHPRGHDARGHDKQFGTLKTRSGSPSGGGTSIPPANTAVGTVASFDGTTLTITLNDGSSVIGKVTAGTEIECRGPGMVSRNDRRDGDPGDRGEHGDRGENGDRGEHRDQRDEGNCMSSDLTPGTAVTGAELRITSAGSFWDKVELERS
jgi:hypothetical protein